MTSKRPGCEKALQSGGYFHRLADFLHTDVLELIHVSGIRRSARHGLQCDKDEHRSYGGLKSNKQDQTMSYRNLVFHVCWNRPFTLDLCLTKKQLRCQYVTTHNLQSSRRPGASRLPVRYHGSGRERIFTGYVNCRRDAEAHAWARGGFKGRFTGLTADFKAVFGLAGRSSHRVRSEMQS